MRRIPNFVLLRAFEAAARLESFTLAAEELHLSQSAISRQIALLWQTRPMRRETLSAPLSPAAPAARGSDWRTLEKLD